MSYPDPASTLGQFQNQARVDRPMSRIENDVITIKGLTDRIQNATDRIIRHAQTLGYFEPPPANASTSAPTPVINNLNGAIMELERHIDRLAASLNVFE